MIYRMKYLRLSLLSSIAIMFLMVSFTAFAESYTADDAKALVGDDPDLAADVLYKLSDMYEEGGSAALKPAVADLVKATNRELSLPEEEQWNLIDLVKVLSMTGDKSVEPMLLRIMSVMWGGGNPFVAQGLLAIGPETAKDVADSLSSKSPDTMGRAALTLHKMYQLAENKDVFSANIKKQIREKLLANLKSEQVNVRIYTVTALRSFGDKSVIPALEFVEKNDAHKDSGGTYEVRDEATETLKLLREKLN